MSRLHLLQGKPEAYAAARAVHWLSELMKTDVEASVISYSTVSKAGRKVRLAAAARDGR